MTVSAISSSRSTKRLPAGWVWAQLGEVCEIIMGQSPEGSSYNITGKGVPLLNGPTEFGTINPIPKQWTTEPTKFAEAGDILLCVRGATTGRKNMADQQYCIGRGLAAIRGNSQRALTGYLWFVLDFITATLLGEASGSTFPNLPGEKLKNIKVLVPPLSEQERIVALLNEQTSAVQKAAEFQGLCSADMYPIKVRPELLDPYFTAWMLISDEFTEYADRESRRARMPKLNREQVFAWEAPVPPLSEQRQIVTMLAEQMRLVERAQKAIEEELVTLETLLKALLEQAFSGKL